MNLALTKEDIDAAQQQGFSSEEKAEAKRSLTRMRKKPCNADMEPTDEMVQLFCSIRKIKQAGDADKDVRIAPGLLREWKTVAYQQVELVDKFYVVPKANAHHWLTDTIVPQCIISPDEFSELPAGVDPSISHIMDDWAPRSSLGPGVRHMPFKAGYRRSKEVPRPGQQLAPRGPAASAIDESEPRGPAASATEKSEDAAGEASEAKRALVAGTEAWAAKARKLLRQNSDTMKRLQEAMENIANEIDSEFLAQNYVQADKMQLCAELWCRKFKENLLAQWTQFQTEAPAGSIKAATEKAFAAQADPFSKGLVGFIVNQLLKKPTYDVLQPFVVLLTELQSELPSFMTQLAKVLLQLAAMSLVSDDTCDTAELGLADLYAWQKSALLKQFLEKRVDAKLKQAQQEKDPDLRQKSLEGLKAYKLKEEQQKSLEVAQTCFGPLPQGQKLKYLLESAERFDILATWSPSHPSLALKRFASKGNAFKDVPAKDFIAWSLQIAANDGAIAAVAQPVAKDLLTTFKKLLQATDGGQTYVFVRDEKLMQVLNALYAELANMKLGVVADLAREEFQNMTFSSAALSSVFFQNVAKVLGGQLKKLQSSAAALVVTRVAPPAQTGDPKIEAVAAAGSTPPNTVPVAAAGEGKAEHAPAAEPAAEAEPHVFAVGDIVRTTSGNQKDHYDNMKGEIVKLGSRPHVKMLEGLSVGKTKDFAKDKLKLFVGIGSCDTIVVPPAGVAPTADDKAKRAADFFAR